MSLIRRIIFWVAYQLIWLALPQVVVDGAYFYVNRVDPTPHSGDQKHQLAYAKLVKQYTTIPKRVLSLAVELAVYKNLNAK